MSDAIDTLAYDFWSVHPSDIPTDPDMPLGYPGGQRAWFYAAHIRAAIALAREEQADRIKQLEAVLREIRDRHIPDQPSALDIDEADYITRQYVELRRIARAALEEERT